MPSLLYYAWLRTIRNPRLKKRRYELVSPDGTSCCVLGALFLAKGTLPDPLVSFETQLKALTEKAGLRDSQGSFKEGFAIPGYHSDNYITSLMTLNDQTRLSLPELADWIEEHQSVVLVNART